ncbi:MAG: glycosyltransferase family 4 protein [Anaerolineae bacterium]|nr:glycosyltransferase family 4 protein [Anaerolineae bacterium]
MRVAMLSVAPVNTHGWARYTRDLITALAGQGAAIVLITSTDADPQTDLPVAAYHRVLPSLIDGRRFTTLRMLAAIQVVQRLAAGCDVVHAVVEPYALLTLLSHRVVVTAHGTYVPKTIARPIVGAFYRRAYRRATLLCVSSYTERQVRAVLPGVRTVMILNGVDVERYQQPHPQPLSASREGSPNRTVPPRYEVERGARGEANSPTVLAVGQVKSRKGYHILAQAMRIVRDTIPDAQAVFIGTISDLAYQERVQQQIDADGLTGAIRWLGRIPDDELLDWYHAADVFALPALNVDGRFEGFGLVYLEASAAGLPVIGSRDCGAEDAIRDGETGFLVPQNDPAATAQAIIRLLQDADLRRRMGAAGAAFAQQHRWYQVARRVLDLYRSC